MDVTEILTRAVDQLLGRASGPFHLRLLIQPLMAALLAIRAGLKDARVGNPAFFWTILTSPEERRILLNSGWKDIGRIFLLALVLDTLYQVVMFRAFYPVQTLIVCVVLVVLPYAMLRGLVTRLTRALYRET